MWIKLTMQIYVETNQKLDKQEISDLVTANGQYKLIRVAKLVGKHRYGYWKDAM